MQGIVYIVRNPLEEPNIYKVGRSSNSAADRARSGQTWISADLEIVREFEVSDCILAESASHTTLENFKIRNEIFKCDIDILIGRVKDAIQPWLMSFNQNSSQHKWLLDYIKEYPVEHGHLDADCGLCRDSYSRTANELMMQAYTDGDTAERRTIHNQRSVELMNNETIGSVLTKAMKYINAEELVKHERNLADTWFNKLDFIFSLDSETGFLVKELLLPPREEYDSRQQYNSYRHKQQLIVIKIKNFNINEIIVHWSQYILPQNAKLLKYCTELVNNKRHEINFGFLPAAKVAVTRAARNYFENNFQNAELTFFQDIKENIFGTAVVNEIDNSYGDEDYQNKQKFLDLYNKKKRIDDEEKEKEMANERTKEINQTVKAYNISKEHAVILVDEGEYASSIADNHYLENNNFQSRFSKKYDIPNIDIVLYSAKNRCNLNQAIWYFYIKQEKKYKAEQKIINLEKERIKVKEQEIANERINLYEKLWNISPKKAHEINKGHLTIKKAVSYKNSFIHGNEKYNKNILLVQREQLSIKHVGCNLKKLKSALIKSFSERKLDALNLKVSIDRKYKVVHIIRNNVELMATLTNIGCYKLWPFDDFPSGGIRQFNKNNFILNCFDYKQNENLGSSNETVKKTPINETVKKTNIENNSTGFKINLKTIFWVGAILVASSMLLN